MIGVEQISRIIDGIYDAALDANGWQGAVHSISRAVGSSSGMLQVQARPLGTMDLLASPGFNPDDMAEYARYYYKCDVWNEAALKQPRSTPLLLSDYVPGNTFEESEIYVDFGRARRIEVFWCLGSFLQVSKGVVGFVGMQKGKKAGDFTRTDQRTLGLITPHLERALLFRQKLELSDESGRIKLAALDALTFGVIVTDRFGRALLANRAAEAMSRSADGFSLGAQGRSVAASIRSETALLHRMIAEAAGGGAILTFQQSPGSMSLTRPSGRRSLIAMAFPLPPERSPLQAFGSPTALLVIHDPETRPQPIQDSLRQIFALSASEARVAAALAGGDAIEEVAVKFGVSVNTVRAQLKQVFAKMGVHRQSELVSLLTRLGITASKPNGM